VDEVVEDVMVSMSKSDSPLLLPMFTSSAEKSLDDDGDDGDGEECGKMKPWQENDDSFVIVVVYITRWKLIRCMVWYY